MTNHNDREAPDLLAAAQAALPALVLPGHYTGDAFAGNTGIPAFDRRAVTGDLTNAIASAGSDQAEAPGKYATDGTPTDPHLELRPTDRQPADRYTRTAEGNPHYTAAPPAGPQPQDHDPAPETDDEDSGTSASVTYGFSYELALIAMTSCQIPRREALKAVNEARRTRLGAAAGSDSTWTVRRTGRTGSSTEFELYQASLATHREHQLRREVKPPGTGPFRRTIWQLVNPDGLPVASALTEDPQDADLHLHDVLDSLASNDPPGRHWLVTEGSNVSPRCHCADAYEDSAPVGRYHLCRVNPAERARFDATARSLTAS